MSVVELLPPPTPPDCLEQSEIEAIHHEAGGEHFDRFLLGYVHRASEQVAEALAESTKRPVLDGARSTLARSRAFLEYAAAYERWLTDRKRGR